MTPREGQSLRVAVLARSVYPLHRFGGLERHVYDLVRCLLSRDVHVTLITPPSSANRPVDAAADAVFRHPKLTLSTVPYVTFPFATGGVRRFWIAAQRIRCSGCVPGGSLRAS